MYLGTVAGGGGLVPPIEVQLPLQTFAGEVVGSVTPLANPLNADGAPPPVRLLSLFHELSHQVTVDEPAVLTVVSPSANTPELGNANTIAVLLPSLDGR